MRRAVSIPISGAAKTLNASYSYSSPYTLPLLYFQLVFLR